MMTFSASFRKVPWIHTRGLIVARQHAVCGVAIRAHRGDSQSALHQSFAMNASR